ncbi:hypothetical protein [Oceanobacillus sp. FSL H7-0719]|uniref:hypothetical protein n=1 Tax=Oceanobacillus sp. FSL H7-0719 TaxID=2954507 RepID=UPI00324F3B29
MEIKFERKDNGKQQVAIRKNTSLHLNWGSDSQFSCNKVNMFISELKTNSAQPREFAVSMRMDGHKDNRGHHRLTQMQFTEEELRQVREQINTMLDD